MVDPAGLPEEIELLDQHASERPAEVLQTTRSPRLGVIALGLLGFVAVAVFFASSDPGDMEQIPTTIPAKEEDPTTTRMTTTSVVATLPAPLVDHAPKLISLPGSGSPLLNSKSSLTLIYVNTRNEPTVVSLDDGTVFRLEIAQGRAYDHFLVESGQVVTTSATSRRFPLATERALGISVYRDEAAIESGPEQPTPVQPRPGIDLCLTPGGCPQFEWSTGSLSNGPDSVLLLTTEHYPMVAALFDGSSWTLDGHWLVSSPEVAFSARIPAPRDSTIWVLHQPTQ